MTNLFSLKGGEKVKQKILCIILSAVLCLTQAAPAFAVQVYDTAGASDVSVAEFYETEEDAESVPSKGVSEDPETVSESEISPAEIVEPVDNIEEPGITVPDPTVEESDSENTEIESTVPSPDIDGAAQQSERDEELVGATIGLGVATRTQSQIKSYLKSSGVDLYAPSTYSRTPNTTAGSYDPGLLSNASLQNNLAAVNLVRYIAGLNCDVTLDSGYTEKAQAASLINYLNMKIDHEPTKPDGISDDLYQLGFNGAGFSNLGVGYKTFGHSLIEGYMADNDFPDNISCVGHRRMVINPSMGKAGFGQVNNFFALYSHDSSRDASETRVAWPAQNMPIEFFKSYFPWSISTGSKEDISKVKVTLTRTSDNAVWTFANDTAAGYFTVNNDPYGPRGCIIFRPDDITYNAGDVFKVNVSGTTVGTIAYKVSFFKLYPIESVTLSDTSLSIEYKSTQALTASYSPSESLDKTITWSSDNTDVATVDSSGNVKAVSLGSAVITAEIGGKKATCDVTVTRASIANTYMSLESSEYPYTGSPIKATVNYVWKDGGKLNPDTDYTLSFKNNVNAGTATVTAKGKGNYTGTTSSTYTITPRNLSRASIAYPGAPTYTGSQLRPTPAVTVSGITLVPDVDFIFSYGPNIEPETGGTITITPKSSNFTGSNSRTFVIREASIADAVVTGIASEYQETGNSIEPIPIVTFNGKKLTSGTDYTVSYGGNRYPGTNNGFIYIKGAGTRFIGYQTVTFSIRAKATPTPKPTKTPTPTPKPTATPKPTSTSTSTPEPTATPKPTSTSTSTPKPTATPKPTSATTRKLFDDVKEPSHPYFNAIYWAVDHGVTKGYTGTNLFGINDSCTRSQAMMFIWRMAGKPQPYSWVKNPFSDITPAHPHYKAVMWAYQNGVAKGFSNGTYGVDKPCTRGQIMTFIWRYAGQQKPKSNMSPFKDSITPAYRTAVLWGAGLKITHGYPDGTYRDKETCTRGQIVTFLYRIKNWAYKK